MEKINQESEYPGFSRRLFNTLSKETISIGNKSRTKTDGQGSEGNVEEGGNKTSQYREGEVFKQFIPCKKEGRGGGGGGGGGWGKWGLGNMKKLQ